MLNELLEYEQYTFRPEQYDPDQFCRRLKPQKMEKKPDLKGNITGIRRPLYIIARKILFDGTSSLSEQKIAEAREALSAWCGFGESKKYPSLNNWFPRYLICCWYTPALTKLLNDRSNPDKDLLDLLNTFRTDMECDTGRFKEIMTKMNAYLRSMDESQNSKEIDEQCKTLFYCIGIITALKASKIAYTTNTEFKLHQQNYSYNTENILRFDDIIADALNAGPLKQYILATSCSETDILQHIQRKVKEKLRILGTITKSKIKGWDILLKLTAAYLLHQAPNQTIVCFKKQDVTSWLLSDSNLDKRDYAEKYFYNPDGHTSSFIFNPPTEKGSNIFFMEMNQNFLHDYGWQVIEIPAGCTWKETISGQNIKTCYVDQGAGKALDVHNIQ